MREEADGRAPSLGGAGPLWDGVLGGCSRRSNGVGAPNTGAPGVRAGPEALADEGGGMKGPWGLAADERVAAAARGDAWCCKTKHLFRSIEPTVNPRPRSDKSGGSRGRVGRL